MKFSREIMKGAVEIIVLQVLKEEGELYGYQLTKAIRAASQGIFELQEGTLYPLLYRMEAKRYITSQKRTAANGKDRRYYAITSFGERLLHERAGELRSFITGMLQVLHLSV